MNRLRIFSTLEVLKYTSHHPLLKADYHQNSRNYILPLLNVTSSSSVSRFYVTENKPSVTHSPAHDLKVSSLLEVAERTGLIKEEIDQALNASPELMTTSPLQWEKCFTELIHNGFEAQDCLKMVCIYPDLLRFKSENISLSLEYWRSAQLGDKHVLSLLERCPYFICMDLNEIARRIPLLQSLSSQKNVTNLLKNSPNLMLEKWSKVEAKMEYLDKVMKVDKKQIIKTFALNRSLDFIKTRHMFLERCGVYVIPKAKVDPEEPNKNPALSLITDSDNHKFATRVAGVTLEEFEVFEELYKVELQRADEKDDSESDEE